MSTNNKSVLKTIGEYGAVLVVRCETEEEAARSGRFTDAADAARQMGTLATKMMAVMEGSLPELATAVSARFEIPQRDVLHLTMQHAIERIRRPDRQSRSAPLQIAAQA